MASTALRGPAQIRDKFGVLMYRCGTVLGQSRRERFLHQMPKGGVCAEIGVFRGHYSREILRIIQPRELHLIDVWWEMFGDCYPDWGVATEFGKLKTRAAYEEALAIVGRYGRNTDCKVHVGESLKVLEQFPDAYFDWVYLDSGHEYEYTLRELEVLARKIKPGKVITGDDFHEDPSHINHGCSVAIREFCEREGWQLGEVDAWSQWSISRA
jgi:hypothetical protein